MLHDEVPTYLELEANIKYLQFKIVLLTNFSENMRLLHKHMQDAGVDMNQYLGLFNHMTEESLKASTELEIYENDLKAEKQRDGVH